MSLESIFHYSEIIVINISLAGSLDADFNGHPVSKSNLILDNVINGVIIIIVLISGSRIACGHLLILSFHHKA